MDGTVDTIENTEEAIIGEESKVGEEMLEVISKSVNSWQMSECGDSLSKTCEAPPWSVERGTESLGKAVKQ